MRRRPPRTRRRRRPRPSPRPVERPPRPRLRRPPRRVPRSSTRTRRPSTRSRRTPAPRPPPRRCRMPPMDVIVRPDADRVHPADDPLDGIARDVRHPTEQGRGVRRLPVHQEDVGELRRLSRGVPRPAVGAGRASRRRRRRDPAPLRQRRLGGADHLVLPGGAHQPGVDGHRAQAGSRQRAHDPRLPVALARHAGVLHGRTAPSPPLRAAARPRAAVGYPAGRSPPPADGQSSARLPAARSGRRRPAPAVRRRDVRRTRIRRSCTAASCSPCSPPPTAW